jgi:hypothetical protein
MQSARCRYGTTKRSAALAFVVRQGLDRKRRAKWYSVMAWSNWLQPSMPRRDVALAKRSSMSAANSDGRSA